MQVNRRGFLQGLLMLPLLAVNPSQANRQTRVRYLSAWANRGGRYFISGLDAQAQVQFDLSLPGRGHAVALSPDGQQAVAIARRPGDYLMVFETQTGKVLHRLQSRMDRHFYGHSVYSADGRWFYSTENDFANGKGMIGVRDVHHAYRLSHEFPSYGIGPHELAILPDGQTLVVANGGIQTHPDTGRAKLNVRSMQPSLAYMDSQTGKLLEQYFLPPDLHQNSIRHLALAPDGQVCCVMQYQGKLTEMPPLVGLHRRGESIQLLTAPQAIQKRMRNYCGSACVDSSGQVFAVSAPRGGLVNFWRAGQGEYLGHVDLIDGCGIAAGTAPSEFLLSSGNGSILRYRLGDKPAKEVMLGSSLVMRWDNHMVSVYNSNGFGVPVVNK
jgi:hypothetical protein